MSRGLEQVGIREVCPFWSSVHTTVAMICTVDVRHQGIQIYVALVLGELPLLEWDEEVCFSYEPLKTIMEIDPSYCTSTIHSQ